MMKTTTDSTYASLLRELLAAPRVHTRNAWVRRLIAKQEVFESTPLVSLRRTAWKNCLREWEWFMSGSNDIKDLHPAVRSWWEPWAGPGGRVYYNYSSQFREFGHRGVFDQIAYLLDGIKNHPFSRRNAITTWNTEEMASPVCPITNCHGSIIQAFVDPSNALHLVTYQRSADFVCGVPHNWLQYWAFLLWLAHRTGRSVGTLTWVGGDVHLYEEHVGLAERMLAAKGSVRPPYPGLVYTPTSEDFRADDFRLDGEYSPAIEERAEMIV